LEQALRLEGEEEELLLGDVEPTELECDLPLLLLMEEESLSLLSVDPKNSAWRCSSE
jgi:hypothetical protein